MQQYFMILVNTLSMMGLCTIFYGAIQTKIQIKNCRRLAVGVIFGIAGIIGMLEPIVLAPGVFVDARGVFVSMAMTFGGPLAAVIAAIMTAAARFLIGGTGMLLGVLVIGMTFVCSGFWLYFFEKQKKRTFIAWLMLTFASVAPTYIVLQQISNIEPQVLFFIIFFSGSLILGFGKMLETEQLRGRRERDLRQAAMTDALTGLPNRRALEEYAKELEQAGANNVMLLLLDIDHFKNINDEFGHGFGDAVLQDIAFAIKGAIRGSDFAARLGGEEFAVIVRTRDITTGFQIAERFRNAVQVPFGDPSDPRILTISVGGFCFNNKPFSYIKGYRQADRALYQSKAEGRNRTTLAPPIEPRLVENMRVG